MEQNQACIGGKLESFNLETDDKTRVCVVGAAKGYPDKPKKGCEITGLDDAMNIEGIEVFGAGIEVREDGLYTSGGRVFNIVAKGDNIIEARKEGNDAMKLISIEGDNLHYRTDIGKSDVKRILR